MLYKVFAVSLTSIMFLCGGVSINAQSGGATSDSLFSGWMLPVVLLLIAGLGGLVYYRFKSGVKVAGQGLALDEPGANQPAPLKDNERRAAKHLKAPLRSPSKSDLAKIASDQKANFSKNYASSGDITHLPIAQISAIVVPDLYDELPNSDDEGLLAAIDEIHDDTDLDSDVRLIALRVMASFKTKNSIDALAQVALYDLSVNLRSKAVGMLADFDHESVFETIVLACADPSREVRAAGARALVKVTFDRSDEWARLAFSHDHLISRQIARAAVESGIAERSFDRLVLRDEKAAYEALALVYLMIRTGETEKIFDAIRVHRDLKVRISLLHAIKIANVAEVIPQLSAFISAEPMASEIADKAREALLSINAVPVNS